MAKSGVNMQISHVCHGWILPHKCVIIDCVKELGDEINRDLRDLRENPDNTISPEPLNSDRWRNDRGLIL